MITITYVTASHPKCHMFEKHALSDARAPGFVAEIIQRHKDLGEINCTIVNENALYAFRVAIAREEIQHEEICLIYSSSKGEERCRFSPYGVVLSLDDKPRYPAAHGVVDETTTLLEAVMQRKKRERAKTVNEDFPI